MQIKVILLLIGTVAIDAGLLNTAFYPKSLYGGYSYTSPYDAIRNYHRARYYAKKSHDLARLRANINGLGFGLYGFRYGSLYPGVIKPTFLGFGPPTIPAIGLSYPKSYQKTYISPPVFPVSNTYVPKSDTGVYTQSYAFGKGYSYSKNIFDGDPFLTNPKIILPPPEFVTPPVPLSKVTPIILGPGFSPYTPGYQYSYFIKDPVVSKGITRPFNGYDSVYGTRYSKFPSSIETKRPSVWKGSSVALEPPFWKGSPIVPDPTFWKGPAVVPTLPVLKDYPITSANPIWKGSEIPSTNLILKGDPKETAAAPWNELPTGSVPISKDPFQFNPNYGVRFDDYQNSQLISSNKESPWNNIQSSSPILGNTGYSLLPPTGSDFTLVPSIYAPYSDPSYDYLSRSDSNSFGNNASPIKSSSSQDLVAYGSSNSKNEELEKKSNSTFQEKED